MQKILFTASLALAGTLSLYGAAYATKTYSEAQGRAALSLGADLAAAQEKRAARAGGARSQDIAALVAEGHLKEAPATPGFISAPGASWELRDGGHFAILELHPDRARFVCEALTLEGGRHYGYLDALESWRAAVGEEVRFGCDIEAPDQVKLFVRI